MPKRRATPPVEYAASVLPGLEEIAGNEIAKSLRDAHIADVQRGWVVFTYPGDAFDLLTLRTTEDVFVLLYRTDRLPAYRKGALPLLSQMARSSYHWDEAMARFRQAHRKSVKRVTFRVIAQMTGRRGFRRQEARDAVLRGVAARWPGWKPVADDAHLEVWVPMVGDWAVIGLRLSNRQMRHRTYKREHRPASLRPTLAAAMVWASGPRPGDHFCDPMCGMGTILAERALYAPYRALLGGDIDVDSLQAAIRNLSQAGVEARLSAEALPREDSPCILHLWDARSLPLHSGTIDALVCNLPFGEKVGSHADNPALYDRFFQQTARVLRLGGRAVLLTSEKELVQQYLERYTQLQREQQILVGVLGKAARIYVLRKV
jgi:tRNA (guanine6-N2)-methyltransferase